MHEFGFNDSAWENVSLPHTWNAMVGSTGRTGVVEGGEHYYRGLAGYRKSFTLPEFDAAEKSLFIEFGAANTVAEVYMNEQYVGTHMEWFLRIPF